MDNFDVYTCICDDDEWFYYPTGGILPDVYSAIDVTEDYAIIVWDIDTENRVIKCKRSIPSKKIVYC